MSNYIGENIKRLRLHKNITQEKLSEHMSVSTQAVSKWERCETYPDISMIVPLASYFGITTDELLGFDEAKNQAVISKYLEDYAELKREAKWTESVDLITKAHKEFPNNFLITIRY
ncbi:MAG TPA: XRE family transcriptional regulator, partial [Clostridiales bacterium]|nr:XRE family transcriptional regulator [Clostridiales bacterium]